MRLAFGELCRSGTPEQRGVVAEEDGDAVEAGSGPDELAGSAELVELLGAVAGHPPRQHLCLPETDRQRQRL